MMKTIVVNLEETMGVIKPLHGVNNGPLHACGLWDLSDVQVRVSSGAGPAEPSRAAEAWTGPAGQAGGKMDVLTGLAAADPGSRSAAILVSTWDGNRGLTRLEVNGPWVGSESAVEVGLIDPSHNLEPVPLHARQRVSDRRVQLDLPLGEYAVALIRVGARETVHS